MQNLQDTFETRKRSFISAFWYIIARINPGINVSFVKYVMKNMFTLIIMTYKEEIKVSLTKR